MKGKYFHVFFLILILCAYVLVRTQALETMKNLMRKDADKNSAIKKVTVVIDAGHGGFDPGKVGVNGELEKDVNLAISKKIKQFLEQNDCNVVMTRPDENGLYSEGDRNRKSTDMKKRVEIINSCNPTVAVSIHQNSFSQESSKGAQVFYHNQSEEGKIFAELMQEQIKQTINDGNHRKAKANQNYYMLKKTNCPIIIIECGFLSNYEEAKKLMDDTYQEKMAWAIHLGILNYINNYVNQ